MTFSSYEAAARRARHFRTLERRLFEILGGWVPDEPDPTVKLVLREQSFQHAWHAELWESLLPPGDSGGERGGEGAALAAVLDAVAEPRATLERLVGAYRVLVPRLVVAYAAQREAASTVADRPLRRALGLMLADEVEGWRAGEELVQAWVASPVEAELAGRHAARVEGLLVAAGGLGVLGEE